jgi:hypothetical protein
MTREKQIYILGFTIVVIIILLLVLSTKPKAKEIIAGIQTIDGRYLVSSYVVTGKCIFFADDIGSERKYCSNWKIILLPSPTSTNTNKNTLKNIK